jgi:TatA/E family protein of Tat protein translocase
MFENIGFGELLIIIVVLIVFFGPKRIPDIAQSIGKGIREFKRAMKDVQDEVSKTINEVPGAGSKEKGKIQQPSADQELKTTAESGTKVKL